VKGNITRNKEMEIVIDREKYLVVKNGEEINLPKIEFEILWLLCSVPGKVFSRTKIFEKIWPEKSQSKDRTVDVRFVHLRKIMGSELFKTIKGVGYKIALKETDIKIINSENI
jgi:two-component system alkaline phosphatase synthesis response regulator PhoP